jgi:hypothetical protein
VGFVEGTDLASAHVDVIVTDGFTGNIALKTGEGTARLVGDALREELSANLFSKLGALAALGPLKRAAQADGSPADEWRRVSGAEWNSGQIAWLCRCHRGFGSDGAGLHPCEIRLSGTHGRAACLGRRFHGRTCACAQAKRTENRRDTDEVEEGQP